MSPFLSRLLLVLPLALLAACDDTAMTDFNRAIGVEPPAPEVPPGPPPLPAAVAAVLPPGTPSSLVFQNVDGCYLFSVEVTDPPSGYPVTDAAGNPVCEGQPITVPAGSVPEAPAPAGDA